MQLSHTDTMSESVSDAVIESVHDVFLACLAMEVFPGPTASRVGSDRDGPFLTEMTVMVGFCGAFNGGLRLSCPRHVALTLTGLLLGRMSATICAEAKEALAQLASHIARGIQHRVHRQHNHTEAIHVTPPTVLSGRLCDLSYVKCTTSIRQTFQVDAGLFFVECFYLDTPTH